MSPQFVSICPRVLTIMCAQVQGSQQRTVPVVCVQPVLRSSNPVILSSCVEGIPELEGAYGAQETYADEILELEGSYGAQESVEICQYNEKLPKNLPGPCIAADALSAESCAQNAVFVDENTY